MTPKPEPSAPCPTPAWGAKVSQPPAAQSEAVAWQDDPAADDRWNNGCDFAMTQLCKLLNVDPESVNWDAATETVDGDVQAVISNILRAKYGDDWGPNTPVDVPNNLFRIIDKYTYIDEASGGCRFRGGFTGVDLANAVLATPPASPARDEVLEALRHKIALRMPVTVEGSAAIMLSQPEWELILAALSSQGATQGEIAWEFADAAIKKISEISKHMWRENPAKYNVYEKGLELQSALSELTAALPSRSSTGTREVGK